MTTALHTMDLLTPPVLSNEIGIPEYTLAFWRSRGNGPAFIKVGRHVRYRRADVEAWLTAQTVQTGGTAA